MTIPGFSNYTIETNGEVTNIATGKPVKPRIVRVKNSKYMQVTLRNDCGYTRVYNVMAILALAYLGKPLHEGVVIAKDGNNLNTTLDNVVCTTQSNLTKQAWQNGALNNRHRRERCYNDDSTIMVYEAMQAYAYPVTMTTLSSDLQVPYATVRYSMTELLKERKVRKTKNGFEVIL